MKNYIKLLTVILSTIAVVGCNGGSSESMPSKTPKPGNEAEAGADNSLILLGYDGVYTNADGESLFYSAQENKVYLYNPPNGTYLLPQEQQANRSIIIPNEFTMHYDGYDEINATEFLLNQLNTDNRYPYSLPSIMRLNLHKSGSADIFGYDAQTGLGEIWTPADKGNFIKQSPQDTVFDLAYQSYTDWRNDVLHFSADNKLSSNTTCGITANVEKMPYYYRITSGTITCNPTIDASDYSGVIYKVGNKAVLIMWGEKWTYRTTFDL
ncbi:hypothetical protein [Vibrio cholerae]|uniref:hypothetical protein n=1 Tax=Vibrio cholerae TaxID=666 RepID=UPI001A2535E8|nr:hypothetical protein [Vibrio cholerae]MCX9536176.1 hypothetical protein [Vibrio cholerae]HAS3626677.1 hypothetical protein [Vibrio cholerae]